ncbi:unnamed protein product [Lactuca virosa]|uniref:Uncharacterized protein n=1 Tax=Lactuca virosa TaxID=75947 RepID=A0AAU9PJA1_9ASTR|nr:unnamed protein product [Lactuca virosa]
MLSLPPREGGDRWMTYFPLLHKSSCYTTPSSHPLFVNPKNFDFEIQLEKELLHPIACCEVQARKMC